MPGLNDPELALPHQLPPPLKSRPALPTPKNKQISRNFQAPLNDWEDMERGEGEEYDRDEAKALFYLTNGLHDDDDAFADEYETTSALWTALKT